LLGAGLRCNNARQLNASCCNGSAGLILTEALVSEIPDEKKAEPAGADGGGMGGGMY